MTHGGTLVLPTRYEPEEPEGWSGRAATWLRHRPVPTLAVALVAVHVLLRAEAGAGGFFLADDFVLTARASSEPDAAALLEPHNGHVMPGALLWIRAMTALAPYSWGLVLTVSLVLAAVAGVLMYVLLSLLFGNRPAILVPLAVYLFSPFTLNATLWWAAAVQALPLQIAMIAALIGQVQLVRTGRRWWAAVPAVSFVLGLAFFEKAVLIPAVICLVTAFLLLPGSPLRQIRSALRRYWYEWVALGVLAVGYLLLYSSLTADDIRQGSQAGDVVTMTSRAVGRTIVPGIVGGPWTWRPYGEFSGGIAAPPGWAMVLSWHVLALAVFASVFVRRRASRAWLVLGLLVIADLAALVYGRLWFFGPDVALEYRNFADLAPVVSLCLAWAFLPTRDESSTYLARGRRLLDQIDRHQIAGVVAVAVAVNVLLVSGGLTHVRYGPTWDDNPAAEWMANARADLDSAGPRPQMFEQPMPAAFRVLPQPEYNRLSLAISVLPRPPQFVRTTDRLATFAADGHVRPATVAGINLAKGPVSGCGWAVRGSGVIPLDAPIYAWSWSVRLGYFTSADVTGTLHLGDAEQRVRFLRGAHDLFLPVNDGGATLRLELDDPGPTICIGNGAVGNVVAVP